MSGTWIKHTPRPHGCATPRETRKQYIAEGDLWRCECGQVWEYWWNYAGEGWSRK